MNVGSHNAPWVGTAPQRIQKTLFNYPQAHFYLQEAGAYPRIQLAKGQRLSGQIASPSSGLTQTDRVAPPHIRDVPISNIEPSIQLNVCHVCGQNICEETIETLQESGRLDTDGLFLVLS